MARTTSAFKSTRAINQQRHRSADHGRYAKKANVLVQPKSKKAGGYINSCTDLFKHANINRNVVYKLETEFIQF